MTRDEIRLKADELRQVNGKIVVFDTKGSGFYWNAPDNLVATCTICGAEGRERPHNPLGPRICLACAMMAFDDERDFVTATPATLAEVTAYRSQN